MSIWFGKVVRIGKENVMLDWQGYYKPQYRWLCYLPLDTYGQLNKMYVSFSTCKRKRHTISSSTALYLRGRNNSMDLVWRNVYAPTRVLFRSSFSHDATNKINIKRTLELNKGRSTRGFSHIYSVSYSLPVWISNHSHCKMWDEIIHSQTTVQPLSLGMDK